MVSACIRTSAVSRTTAASKDNAYLLPTKLIQFSLSLVGFPGSATAATPAPFTSELLPTPWRLSSRARSCCWPRIRYRGVCIKSIAVTCRGERRGGALAKINKTGSRDPPCLCWLRADTDAAHGFMAARRPKHGVGSAISASTAVCLAFLSVDGLGWGWGHRHRPSTRSRRSTVCQCI